MTFFTLLPHVWCVSVHFLFDYNITIDVNGFFSCCLSLCSFSVSIAVCVQFPFNDENCVVVLYADVWPIFDLKYTGTSIDCQSACWELFYGTSWIFAVNSALVRLCVCFHVSLCVVRLIQLGYLMWFLSYVCVFVRVGCFRVNKCVGVPICVYVCVHMYI